MLLPLLPIPLYVVQPPCSVYDANDLVPDCYRDLDYYHVDLHFDVLEQCLHCFHARRYHPQQAWQRRSLQAHLYSYDLGLRSSIHRMLLPVHPHPIDDHDLDQDLGSGYRHCHLD